MYLHGLLPEVLAGKATTVMPRCSRPASTQRAIPHPRIMGRLGLVGVLVAALTAGAGLSWGTATAHAEPVAFDVHAFELQVMQQINEARQNPKGMETMLRKSNVEADWYHNRIAGRDTRFQVDRDRAYYKKATDEAGQQPPLAPLVWSEKLATLSRNWVNANDSLAHGDYTARSTAAGTDGYPHIEAIGFGFDRDPLSVVYGFWISDTDNWKLNSPYHPDLSYKAPGNDPDWRGHRGIVNDAHMNAIGVACLPRTSAWNEPIVKCVIDTGENLPDAPGAAAATPGGTPSLSTLPATLSGSVGQTTPPGQIVTIDTAATPSQSPTAMSAPASASPPPPPPLATPASTNNSAPSAPPPSSTSSSTPSAPPAAEDPLFFSYCTTPTSPGTFTCSSPAGNAPDLTGSADNDAIQNITVGPNVWLTLYADVNFTGTCQSFTNTEQDLGGTRIGPGTTSSYTITRTKPADC